MALSPYELAFGGTLNTNTHTGPQRVHIGPIYPKRNPFTTSADPEGGQGVRTHPGKSQVIWVSIGNKQLDPPGKCWPPMEP